VEWVKEVERDSWASFKTRMEGTWRGEEQRGGSWGSRNGWRRRRGHGHREKQREGGLEVDDEDLSAIFQKCKDSTVKTKQLSDHSSNENVPKSKSVEFKKIYNLALRFSFERVKDLNLF
jgi:hypothetical protein